MKKATSTENGGSRIAATGGRTLSAITRLGPCLHGVIMHPPFLERRSIFMKKQSPTLRQLIGNYIDCRRNILSPCTIRCYDMICRTRFQSIADIPVVDIKSWQAQINHEAVLCSAKTLKNAWGLVSSALSAGGYPVPKVSLPKIMPSNRPWLTPEQIPIFIEAVKGTPCEITALLALHSLRRSEIAALTWKHIDLENGLIHVISSAVPGPDNQIVYRSTTKSRKSYRTVPIMIPDLKRALTSVPEKERVGLVLTCSVNRIWDQINHVCESAGLPKVGVHGLRHSFASLAHHIGLPEEETMLIGGWEDINTMRKIYTHVSQADQLRAVNRMAEFYQNLSAREDQF